MSNQARELFEKLKNMPQFCLSNKINYENNLGDNLDKVVTVSLLNVINGCYIRVVTKRESISLLKSKSVELEGLFLSWTNPNVNGDGGNFGHTFLIKGSELDKFEKAMIMQAKTLDPNYKG